MKFWHKALLAFVVTIVGPLIGGLAMIPEISAKGHLFLCLPGVIFNAPLLGVALMLRHFHLRKTAVWVFSAGMWIYISGALFSLTGEWGIGGALFGGTNLPAIACAVPLGLFAILDRQEVREEEEPIQPSQRNALDLI